MRRFISSLGLGSVLGLVLFAAIARADEKKIPLDQVPKAVMAAIKNRFPGANITSVEKEKEDGKIVYDVELKQKGRKFEMDIQEDGTIVEIEKVVATKDVPEAVLKAVEAKYPKSRVEEIMEVNKVEGKKETPIHYEITFVTADNKKKEVEVSLDGKKIGKEEVEKK
jgi:uncharacterized membrane protein YkoI